MFNIVTFLHRCAQSGAYVLMEACMRFSGTSNQASCSCGCSPGHRLGSYKVETSTLCPASHSRQPRNEVQVHTPFHTALLGSSLQHSWALAAFVGYSLDILERYHGHLYARSKDHDHKHHRAIRTAQNEEMRHVVLTVVPQGAHEDLNNLLASHRDEDWTENLLGMPSVKIAEVTARFDGIIMMHYFASCAWPAAHEGAMLANCPQTPPGTLALNQRTEFVFDPERPIHQAITIGKGLTTQAYTLLSALVHGKTVRLIARDAGAGRFVKLSTAPYTRETVDIPERSMAEMGLSSDRATAQTAVMRLVARTDGSPINAKDPRVRSFCQRWSVQLTGPSGTFKMDWTHHLMRPSWQEVFAVLVGQEEGAEPTETGPVRQSLGDVRADTMMEAFLQGTAPARITAQGQVTYTLGKDKAYHFGIPSTLMYVLGEVVFVRYDAGWSMRVRDAEGAFTAWTSVPYWLQTRDLEKEVCISVRSHQHRRYGHLGECNHKAHFTGNFGTSQANRSVHRSPSTNNTGGPF